MTSDHGLPGPHLAVDAYSALQFLGVTAAAISAQRDALSDLSVPVLLDVTADGDPSGAAVEGSQVAHVLEDGGVALSESATNYVAKSHARVVLDYLGEPVRVARPAKALLLAADAPKNSSCPANQ